jgi:flagellar biosynthetic protein FlhB
MPEDVGGDKSLPASPLKRQRARDDGNVARSQDLSSAAALTVALLTLVLVGPYTLSVMIEAAQYYLGNASQIMEQPVPLRAMGLRVFYYVGLCMAPFLAAMIAAGLSLNLIQVGFLFTTKPLQPKFERLNPITGLQKFVSARSLVELIKSLTKLVLITAIIWFTLRSRWQELILLMNLTPLGLLGAVGGLVAAVWWRIAVAMIILGIADYGYQWWQHGRDLRMTVREAREEVKELEGDPAIKRRVRQLQRQIAMQRMMAEVPKADVIVTNPTEYAVALRYELSEMRAPVVVAKGARLTAQRIRDLAAEHDVPIVQKPELARALFRSVEIGQTIPEDLFHTVAEVLAFVYQIDRREEKMSERRKLVASG